MRGKFAKPALAAITVLSMAGLNMQTAVAATTHPTFQTTIELNGKVLEHPNAFVYDKTTFMPIWYVQQVLNQVGISNNWNGSSTPQKWTMTDSQTTGSSLSLNGGSGTVEFVLNGKVVERGVTRVVAKDSGTPTTYVPIWYVQEVLRTLGITNTWNGNPGAKLWTLTYNAGGSGGSGGSTSGSANDKAAVVTAMMKALGVSPISATSSPWSDLPTSNPNFGYVNAAVKNGWVNPDSSTKFGTTDAVTVTQMDTVYWNYIGITSADAKYNPGGSPYAWGNDIGLNRALSGNTDLTTGDVSQTATNLKDLQQGYYVVNGVDHVLYTPKDEYKADFQYAVMPSGFNAQAAITETYKLMDSITIYKSGSYMYAKFDSPTKSSGYDFSSGGSSMSAGTYYSFNGSSWHHSLEYDSMADNPNGNSPVEVREPSSASPIQWGFSDSYVAGSADVGLLSVELVYNSNNELTQTRQ